MNGDLAGPYERNGSGAARAWGLARMGVPDGRKRGAVVVARVLGP